VRGIDGAKEDSKMPARRRQKKCAGEGQLRDAEMQKEAADEGQLRQRSVSEKRIEEILVIGTLGSIT
jgi:hypothetical protein